MKNIKPAVIFFFAMMTTACGGGSSNDGGSAQNLPKQAITKVVALGDSISAGAAISEPPWPPLLAQALGVEVVAVSGPGKSTNWGLSVIQRAIDENKPSHIAILLGTNDALSGSVPQAIANLRSLVSIANNNGVTPIIGTIPILAFVPGDKQAIEINKGIEELNAFVAQVRRSVGTDQTILVDGIHPSGEGQQRIANAFRDAMR